MKERFRRAYETVTPPRSDEALYQAVLEQSRPPARIRRRFSSKAFLIAAAAIVGCPLFALGAGAVYEQFHYLGHMLSDPETSATEHIQETLFTDSTEHICFTVEELLSDGQETHATVHFRALTDHGKYLMNDVVLPEDNHNLRQHFLHLENETPISCAYGAAEIEELRTETDRYFHLKLSMSHRPAVTDTLTLYYNITGAQRSTTLTVNDLLKVRYYTAECLSEDTDPYDVAYLAISDLSYSLYMNCEETSDLTMLFKRYGLIEGDSEISEIDKNSFLLLNGAGGEGPAADRVQIGNSSAGFTVIKGAQEQSDKPIDMQTVFNAFYIGGEYHADQTMFSENYRIPTIDSAKVTGLILGGVEYRLVPMK